MNRKPARGWLLGIAVVLVSSMAAVSVAFAQGGTWTTKAPLPGPQGSTQGAVVDGILYVIGGANDSGDVATVEAYNPTTDTWSSKTPMPTPHRLPGVGVVNGIIYSGFQMSE